MKRLTKWQQRTEEDIRATAYEIINIKRDINHIKEDIRKYTEAVLLLVPRSIE